MADEIQLLNGNEAAALAAYLAGTEYVAGYPITPSTQAVEQLSKFAAKDRKLKFENVESEYSAMAKLIGASLGGCRTFTATSSHGLALMHELLHIASSYALPIVMAVANRSIGMPWNIWADQGDSLSQIYTGWIQMYCKNVQEVFDSVLLGFKVAENPNILTPMMICYDGFTISQTKEPIVVPSKEKIKEYLPKLNLQHKISLKMPGTLGGSSCSYYFSKFRKNAMKRLANALKATKDAIYEFEKVFGRKISPIIDGENSYQNLHAENICISMGGISGAVEEAVDKINLELDESIFRTLRIKLFNPFPKEKIRYLLGQNKIKKIIVLNNSPHPVLTEQIERSLYRALNQPPIKSLIVGVGGSHEVSSDFLAEKIKKALVSEEDDDALDKIWCLDPKTAPRAPKLAAVRRADNLNDSKLITSGHRACQGCGAITPLNLILDILGSNTMLSIPACCWSIIAGPYPFSPIRVPTVHCAFASGVQTAGGIKSASELKGEKINSVVYGGDGSFFDIGFGALSAAAERGDKIICFCYDNEAYMNTGVQRSGATPKSAFTETDLKKTEDKKDIIEIMAAHKIPYAATAVLAPQFLNDFIEKVKKAKQFQKEGLCFIHILAPCPTGWGFKTKYTVELARLAVWSGVFPLYEVSYGKYKITYQFESKKYGMENVDLLERYLNLQSRFKNLTTEDKKLIKQRADEKWRRLRQLEKIFIL